MVRRDGRCEKRAEHHARFWEETEIGQEASTSGFCLGARGGTAQNSAAAIRNVRVLDFTALWLRKLGEAC
jgi:hypothetical protein